MLAAVFFRRSMLVMFAAVVCLLAGIALASSVFTYGRISAATNDEIDEASKGSTKPIAPAEPTNTGLLLETPLDLSQLTRDKFLSMMATVGAEKIGKTWTSAVVSLPNHPTTTSESGLTEDEVKAYMLEARRLFDAGEAVPVSDVGLISTQEDVIRQPMLNHISAFQNNVVRVYLLVQKTASGDGWGYFSIVQDMTVDPPLDYFSELKESGPLLQGRNCYKCHSSGPLAIHPAREDLVLDARLAAEVSRFIAEQPRSQFHFPANDPADEYGEAMTLSFCAECHSSDGLRGPLHRVHSHPIRVLVDFGYMPPDRKLTIDEIAELKAWLEKKPL